MEISVAVEERREVKETPAQKLLRVTRQFLADLARTALLAAVFLPIILASFLTLDIPVKEIDHLFSTGLLKPSNWFTWGGFFMALGPMAGVLIARRFGGDEASRAITAAWGIAAVAVVAELTYLAPVLEEGDFPSTRFVVAFVASAMAGQFLAVTSYDFSRGSGSWWRAPLFATLIGYGVQAVIYYPSVYWGAGAPWANWMVTDFAVKSIFAFSLLPIYWRFRKKLKPRGGFGG